MAKICKYCGNELKEQAVFCKICGMAVDGSTASETDDSSEFRGANAPPMNSSWQNNMQTMKHCPNCGNQIRAEASFCKFCGFRFTDPASPSFSQNSDIVERVESFQGLPGFPQDQNNGLPGFSQEPGMNQGFPQDPGISQNMGRGFSGFPQDSGMNQGFPQGPGMNQGFSPFRQGLDTGQGFPSFGESRSMQQVTPAFSSSSTGNLTQAFIQNRNAQRMQANAYTQAPRRKGSFFRSFLSFALICAILFVTLVKPGYVRNFIMERLPEGISRGGTGNSGGIGRNGSPYSFLVPPEELHDYITEEGLALNQLNSPGLPELVQVDYTDEERAAAETLRMDVDFDTDLIFRENTERGEVTVELCPWNIENDEETLEVRLLPEKTDPETGAVLTGYDISYASGQSELETSNPIYLPVTAGEDETGDILWKNPESGLWEAAYYELTDDNRYEVLLPHLGQLAERKRKKTQTAPKAAGLFGRLKADISESPLTEKMLAAQPSGISESALTEKTLAAQPAGISKSPLMEKTLAAQPSGISESALTEKALATQTVGKGDFAFIEPVSYSSESDWRFTTVQISDDGFLEYLEYDKDMKEIFQNGPPPDDDNMEVVGFLGVDGDAGNVVNAFRNLGLQKKGEMDIVLGRLLNAASPSEKYAAVGGKLIGPILTSLRILYQYKKGTGAWEILKDNMAGLTTSAVSLAQLCPGLMKYKLLAVAGGVTMGKALLIIAAVASLYSLYGYWSSHSQPTAWVKQDEVYKHYLNSGRYGFKMSGSQIFKQTRIAFEAQDSENLGDLMNSMTSARKNFVEYFWKGMSEQERSNYYYDVYCAPYRGDAYAYANMTAYTWRDPSPETIDQYIKKYDDYLAKEMAKYYQLYIYDVHAKNLEQVRNKITKSVVPLLNSRVIFWGDDKSLEEGNLFANSRYSGLFKKYPDLRKDKSEAPIRFTDISLMFRPYRIPMSSEEPKKQFAPQAKEDDDAFFECNYYWWLLAGSPVNVHFDGDGSAMAPPFDAEGTFESEYNEFLRTDVAKSEDGEINIYFEIGDDIFGTYNIETTVTEYSSPMFDGLVGMMGQGGAFLSEDDAIGGEIMEGIKEYQDLYNSANQGVVGTVSRGTMTVEPNPDPDAFEAVLVTIRSEGGEPLYYAGNYDPSIGLLTYTQTNLKAESGGQEYDLAALGLSGSGSLHFEKDKEDHFHCTGDYRMDSSMAKVAADIRGDKVYGEE